ncbi:hypothetical protein SISNIDRAFT_414920 [Sistotremastrum niveocremeum HHB9708]|uniref:Uncharacterized protein n=1 Tax=Sistotremastrum niveocremeum HHB9708 TaxID=1314777 RepID=A0A164RPN0_9AGAM|nr:hypothetical protein SISNIDRAFT_414920 [Sistotremastrum niveocremeum HHB9708]
MPCKPCPTRPEIGSRQALPCPAPTTLLPTHRAPQWDPLDTNLVGRSRYPHAQIHLILVLDPQQQPTRSTNAPDSNTVAFTLPANVPEWSAAIAECQALQLLPSPAPGRLYIVPPSHIFLVKDRLKRLRMVVNWLHVRESWFARIQKMDPQEASINIQGWRDYLTHSPDRGSLQRSTANLSGRKAQKKALSVNSLLIFHTLLPNGVPQLDRYRDYTWFGHTLDSEDPEQQVVTERLVLWEIDELGFRYDFLRLARHFTNALSLPEERHALQEEAVYRIWSAFPTRDKMFIDGKPPGDCGLGSFIWNFSIPSLEAARHVVSTWPNPPRELLSPLLTPPEANNLLVVRHVQQKLAQFYCQTYVKIFQAAPVLPSQLPLPFVSL